MVFPTAAGIQLCCTWGLGARVQEQAMQCWLLWARLGTSIMALGLEPSEVMVRGAFAQ